MNYLALSIGGNTINTPQGIPTGGTNEFQHILGVGIDIFLIIIIFLTLLYIIFAGFMWMMSGGEKGKIENAQHTLQYAIIGLIITLLAFVIINAVGNFFSVPLS